jgi:hypothetical protein
MARLTNRIPSLVPANVDAAFQSEVFEHAADLLLSSLVSELPSNGLRGIGQRFRQ